MLPVLIAHLKQKMENNFEDLKQVATQIKKELGINERETLKLERNSKSYNWEIKTFIKESDTKSLERLEQINSVLIEKYGMKVE